MGVYAPHLVPLVAEAMGLLGTRHAFVVHGNTGISRDKPGEDKPGELDELSISGSSQIAEVRTYPGRAPQITLSTIIPEQFNLTRAPIEALAGEDAAANAAILRDIFSGAPGPRRDVVLLNAAAVLVTAGLTPDIAGGIQLAARTIDRGKVTELLADLARTTERII
jgi:anthranilate phosphoribosyltransferase